ncbi:MAG: DUF11 domain-containing protein, partial [Bacteroidia bacterium]|nr:DUF11 domain-containing protein [Bacteroidia bacterium]
ENTFLKLSGLDSLFSLTNIFRSKGLYYFSGVARPEGDVKANGIFQLFPIKKAIRAYRKFSDIYFAESNNKTIYLSGNFPYQLTQNKYTFKLGRVDDSLQRFYGRIFYDRNNDGVFNNGDVRPGEKSIKVAPYNLLIPVDPSGFFSFIIPKGKSQLVKISLSKTAEIQAGFNYIFNADTFTEKLINFPLKLNKNDFADIRVRISAAAGWQVRKDTSELYVLKVSNNGVVAATPDVNLNFNGKIVLIKPFPAPNVINPGKITWEKQALQPGEEKYYLIKLTTPSSDFAVNDEVKFEAGVANFVDDNPADNMDTLSQTVSAGVQGNAKLQFPEVQNGNSYADLDPYAGKIEYIIRFTNTTSDTIRTVVVRDTISTPDYVTYIQETGASHAFYRDVQTSPNLPDKVIVAYTFSNIKLPPNPTGNTELVNSSGYIGFRLGLAPALTSGTQLSNTAYIHLDNYAAIRTNTAMAQVQSTGIKAVHSSGNFTVFPNPFVDVLNFNSTAENGNFRLTDMQGRTLLQTVISNRQIDLSNLELAQSAYIWSIILPNGDTGSGIIIKK